MIHSEYVDPDGPTRLEGWGGRKLVQQMIRLFLEHSPERMAQIREGVRTDTADPALRGAHSLKSTSANLGAMKLSALARVAEEAAEDGNVERVRTLLPELESVYTASCEALAAIEGAYLE
jgi:two-component system sensor histidine kinase/response regulator